jgi:hypothetical protein
MLKFVLLTGVTFSCKARSLVQNQELGKKEVASPELKHMLRTPPHKQIQSITHIQELCELINDKVKFCRVRPHQTWQQPSAKCCKRLVVESLQK